MNNKSDIGHPVTWTLGSLLIAGMSALMAWAFFGTIQNLINAVLHCRACG